MIESYCNCGKPHHRPRSITRRRVPRSLIDNTNPPDLRETQRKMKYWLSLAESQNVCDEDLKEPEPLPIFSVTMSDSSKNISEVLAQTPDINIKDNNGYTPLHLAVLNNNVKAVKLFMARRPILTVLNAIGDTSLHIASATQNINLEIIQAILVEKKCLNARNTSGLTPLHIATINNNIKLMVEYLKLGAKPDMMDYENGWTPLHHATMARHSKATLLLLRYRANPNITDRYGQSPLFNAVMGGDLGAVMDIVRYRANIYLCDKFGQTPIHLAARNTTDTILSWFLTNWNVNINCQNYRGQTLLHCAVEDNRHGNIRAILQREPDLEIQDEKGLTAFDLHHHDEIIKHVIKLKVAKLPVSNRILDIVYTIIDPDFIEKHEKVCYEELQQMKKITFPGLLMSYYKFTFTTLQKRAEYMMNKQLPLHYHETYSSELSIRHRFPIYWGTIEQRYFKAHNRRKPLEKFEYEKYKIFGSLPDHCISNIFSYLDTEDIIEILKAL